MKTGFAKFVFLLLTFVLVGCASGGNIDTTLVPTFALPSETQTPLPATASPMIVGGETAAVVTVDLPVEAAVILVGGGDTLNLRAGAGVENSIITEVPYNATGLLRTGVTAFSGEDLWAEVRTSTGETGWVNARYLTEYVSPERFCRDPQVQFLFDNLLVALESENGELFSSLVSPRHGLDLRYFHHGTLANYTTEEATWVFQSSYEVVWGNAGGSGLEVKGTFSEIPLPRLREVFGAAYELYCNDVGQLNAFAQQPWLPEYKNINFYQVFKPGTETYGGLDWRAWLVGVEYVSGKPYLFALTSFEWEP